MHNSYRFYTELYSKLYVNNRILNKLLSPLRRLVIWKANIDVPKFFARMPKHFAARVDHEGKIIVSLTSFPARIEKLWIVIECMLRQSIRVDKIYLWLSKDQFPCKAVLPQSLLSLEKKDCRFSIRIEDGDLRSHKKYYYAMRNNPEDIVITVDDDVIYPDCLISKLWEAHVQYPNAVVANVVSKYCFDDGKLQPYLKWRRTRTAGVCMEGVPIGYGGVLYPPHSLDENVFDSRKFMELCPNADDLWLNAMAQMKGTRVVKTGHNGEPIDLTYKDAKSLDIINNHSSVNMNDVQLANILGWFSNSEIFVEHK